MLEAFDAFKIKYEVHTVKMHREQNVDHLKWTNKKTSHCNSRVLFPNRKAPTKNRQMPWVTRMHKPLHRIDTFKFKGTATENNKRRE